MISGHRCDVGVGPNECPVDYLCGEISTGFELFEEGGHEEGGEEEDSGPEENVWGVWTVVATRRPDKLSMQVYTLLLRMNTEGVLAKRKWPQE